MKFDYLTLHPDAFGLDLSDVSVRIAYVKEKDGHTKPVFFGESELPNGLIEDGIIKKKEEVAKHLRELLKDSQKKGLDTNYVIASLPEERAFLQVIELPRMKREDVGEAVYFEAANHIPYQLETVYIAHRIIKETKDHFDVLLASLPKNVVDSYLEVLLTAGYVPLALEVESLAISRALIRNQASSRPVLLVDIGITSTNINIFFGNSVRFATSLPVSASQLTKAITKTLLVKPEEAENLKKKYGLAERQDKEGKEIFEALVPSLTDLVEQMRKYIEYYESHAEHQHASQGESQIQSVLLVGGGALLRGLPQFLAQALKLDISLGNPWVNILSQGAQEVPEMSFTDSLRYTTALGSALRAFEHRNEDIV